MRVFIIKKQPRFGEAVFLLDLGGLGVGADY